MADEVSVFANGKGPYKRDVSFLSLLILRLCHHVGLCDYIAIRDIETVTFKSTPYKILSVNVS